MDMWFPIVYWSGFVIAFLLTWYYYDANDGGLLPIMLLIGFIWPISLIIVMIVLIYSSKDSLEKWKRANRERNDSSRN